MAAQWLAIIGILPTIINGVKALMGFAEEQFGPKTGEDKKTFVLSAASDFGKTMENISSGGQKDTWSAVNQNWSGISAALGAIVDFLAPLLFPKPKE